MNKHSTIIQHTVFIPNAFFVFALCNLHLSTIVRIKILPYTYICFQLLYYAVTTITVLALSEWLYLPCSLFFRYLPERPCSISTLLCSCWCHQGNHEVKPKRKLCGSNVFYANDEMNESENEEMFVVLTFGWGQLISFTVVKNKQMWAFPYENRSCCEHIP